MYSTAVKFSPTSQLVDMKGWVQLGGERQEVLVTTKLDQGLVEADLGDVPDVYQDLHWHAPRSYLGDKVCTHLPCGSVTVPLHNNTP